MKVGTFTWRNRFLFPCDGDAGGDTGAGAGAGAGAGDGKGGDGKGGDGKGGAAGGDDKKFTQADFNRELAKEKEKTRQQNQALIQQLEELKGIKSLSDEQRASFEQQIDELRNQSLSKEQLAEKEKLRQKTEYEGKLAAEQNATKTWKSRYDNELVTNALAAAASKAKAYNPSQIEALLRPHSKVAEIIDDKQPTGKFQVLLDFTYTDDKGKPVTLSGVTADEVLKTMKDLDEYANLFIDEGTGGVGGSGNRDASKGRAKSLDQVAKMTEEEFREYRKKNPGLVPK